MPLRCPLCYQELPCPEETCSKLRQHYRSITGIDTKNYSTTPPTSSLYKHHALRAGGRAGLRHKRILQTTEDLFTLPPSGP